MLRRVLSNIGLFLLIVILIATIVSERILVSRIVELRDNVTDLYISSILLKECQETSGDQSCSGIRLEYQESMRAVLENPFFGALGSYESTFGEQISTIRKGFSGDQESIVTNPGLFEAIERLLLLTRDYGDQQFASLSILTDVSVLLVIGLFIMLFLLNSQNQRVAIQLTKTLREKEFLIKEVHHRVKNNLNMVKGLISLKALDLGDTALLSDIESHVGAISRLHEKLYQGGDAEMIEISAYLTELIQGVFASSNMKVPELQTRLRPLTIEPDRAIALGLITNEAATNAIKHAFPGEPSPRFEMELQPLADGSGQWALECRNNGRRFPPDFSAESGAGLGLRLMESLAGQVGGELTIRTGAETALTVRFFPFEQKGKRSPAR
jgi:two-component sensor histidine kinase